MKNVFKQYYQPSNEEFEALWKDAIFSFDANVLLNFYRYTDETRKQLIEIMEKVSDRVWLTYQVGMEFHRNRREVISKQTKAYSELKITAQQSVKSLKDEFGKICNKHSLLKSDELEKLADKFSEVITKKVDAIQSSHPNYNTSDPLLDTITKLFNNKVGSPYDATQSQAIFEEGSVRYSQQIPPGYKDAADKKGNDKYGIK
jgi:hypothetical protein